MFQKESCRENQITHIMFKIFFSPKTISCMRYYGKNMAQLAKTGHRW